MKPGRNDPCPCGSGKKYKHCCLNAGSVPAAAPADLSWRRLRALLDGFATEMLRFTAEAYGPLALHEAWDVFTGHDDIEFDPNTPLMQLFMPWFFHCWAPDPVTTRWWQWLCHSPDGESADHRNRTPMDAVKDPDGREIVESLVIQGERLGRNLTSSTDVNVFRRLRERLGLTGSQNQSTRGLSTSS